MEDDGGRFCCRHCPGRDEARQKVWTGRAAEAQLDLSQARGFITRSAATTDGTISSPFTRRSCAAPQDRKSLLSQEIRTDRLAACNNVKPGETKATTSPLGTPTAPIVGYCPTGLHESTTPLGKYYPTNYEARKRTKRAMAEKKAVSVISAVPTSTGASPTSPPSSALSSPKHSRTSNAIPGGPSPPKKPTAASPFRSHGPPVIHVSRPAAVVRPVSEFSAVSSPLIQYKRDMVTQTVQKAKDVVQYAVAVGAQLDEKTQAQITRSLTLLSLCSKPKSPKIRPTIMSPGPVTPMTLDGETETDYLTARPQNHPAA
ncbi:hypothetical protein DL546_002040 [Coniochaeta pulveracea]|uniref:Uncharacterized protein n=1 Tax=Coniochaeta pulveracea TaxID=177199 RepID=A0A420XXV4_9PEZI|nr:hypothetical protein DL546_002040 [Coniochaeta pulveracea]